MIRKRWWAARLKRMNEVSPALKVLAVAALPVSNHKPRRKILGAIRNTANMLADPGSIRDAEGAIVKARAEADAEGAENLDRMDGGVQLPAYRRGVGLYRGSYRSLAKMSSRRAYARLLLDALNDTLASIGRPAV